MNLVDYTVALRKALHQEGISHTAYAIALAVAAGKARTVYGLKLELGLSAKGVRDCVGNRHSWMFSLNWQDNPRTLSLTPEGKLKLSAIARRLPLEKPAPAPPRRARPSIAESIHQLTLPL